MLLLRERTHIHFHNDFFITLKTKKRAGTAVGMTSVGEG